MHTCTRWLSRRAARIPVRPHPIPLLHAFRRPLTFDLYLAHGVSASDAAGDAGIAGNLPILRVLRVLRLCAHRLRRRNTRRVPRTLLAHRLRRRIAKRDAR
jgi:hypothetical protein